MKAILTIAQKEVHTSFVTPLAYVIMAGFAVLGGFFFFTMLQQFNAVVAQAALMPDLSPSLNEWVVTPFYQTMQVVLVFLLPILTMRSFAEEKQRHTFEMLITSPVSVFEIVVGKFLGVSFVVFLMLLLALFFPATLIVAADPEVMPILIGFLGLCLYSLAFVALGVAISAFARSQTTAAVIGLVLFLLYYVINAPAARLGENIAAVLNYLAPTTHTEMFAKGVMTSSAVVYFLSVMLLGLFICSRALEAQRGR